MQSRATRQREKTLAEFFTGIGLVRLGLESEGWKTAFANDIDPAKEEMYKAHFPDAADHFVPGDIHAIPPSRVPTVTLATASFPCNDLSLAGGRDGLGGKHSSAFWGFVNILHGMDRRRPPLVMLENVPGFLTSHQGEDFKNALLALNELGYAVDSFLLDAAWFVPQSRQRLFVIGTRGKSEIKPPKDSKVTASAVRPKALVDFMTLHPEIHWHIRKLPLPPTRENTLEDVLEDLPADAPEWWSRDRVDYLLNQMSPKHRQIAEKMIAGPIWSYGTVFRRIRHAKSMAELRTDGIAGCLRTPRGGSGRQILFKAGHGQSFARLLTPRECACLMWADDFNITVPLNQALFGFGDAVCVPVIRWVAEHYLNPLFDELAAPHGRLEAALPPPAYGIKPRKNSK